MQSAYTRADPLPALQICTTVYNSMVDIDKAIDKEIGRIPLDTLVEYRRELTTESFIHGGIVPHFHMPAFITSHSFLKCPAFDDHFWSYRLTKENFQKAQRSFPIKEGKKNGLHKTWFENGQKRLEANYKNGKKEGLSTNWFKNGQKKSEENFTDDKLMSSVVWKPNGEKCPVTNIKNGNGIRVDAYYEDGTEVIRSVYKEGERVNE